MVCDLLLSNITNLRNRKTIEHESFNKLFDEILFSKAKSINGWTLKKEELALFDRILKLKLVNGSSQNIGFDKYSSTII